MTAPRPEDVSAPTPEPVCCAGAWEESGGPLGYRKCADCGKRLPPMPRAPTPEKDPAVKAFWDALAMLPGYVDEERADVEIALAAALAEARKPVRTVVLRDPDEALEQSAIGVLRKDHEELVAALDGLLTTWRALVTEESLPALERVTAVVTARAVLAKAKR